jgi:D-lyxose ketol-isomerase
MSAYGPKCTTTRRYVDQTLVLETTFTTSTGKAVLLDSMVVGKNAGALIRLQPGSSLTSTWGITGGSAHEPPGASSTAAPV